MVDRAQETPLTVIRRVEREAARRIEQARLEAEASVTAARRERLELIEAARRRGQEEAERHRAAAIESARQTAGVIEAEGEAAAARVLTAAEPHLDPLVDAMFELVLAPPAEEGK